jgi:hypothetical protein
MKYKVFKIENGLGEIWYQIRVKEWIFYSWIQEYYRSGSEPIRFNTEEECYRYIKNEEEYEKQEALRNQIKITELPGLDRE